MSSSSSSATPAPGTEDLKDWTLLSKQQQKIILTFFHSYFAYRDAQLSTSAHSAQISDEQIITLLGELHLQALKVFPYSCVQRMSFAIPTIIYHPIFLKFFSIDSSPLHNLLPEDAVPASLRNHFTSVSFPKPLSSIHHLDLGCCFGTDLRAVLCSTSIAPSQLLGVDITPDFFSLGGQLYSDSELLGNRYCTVDALDENSVADCMPLQQFRSAGGIHSVYCGAVYHLFTLEKTALLSRNLFTILSPGGVLWGFFGGASATGKGGENGFAFGSVDGSKNREEASRYFHSTKSFAKLLNESGYTDIVVVEEDWLTVMKRGGVSKSKEGDKLQMEKNEKEEKEKAEKWKDTAMIVFSAKKPSNSSD